MENNTILLFIFAVIALLGGVIGYQIGYRAKWVDKDKPDLFSRMIEAANYAYNYVETLKKSGVFPQLNNATQAEIEARVLEIEQRAASEARKYLIDRYGIDVDFGKILDYIRAVYSGWQRSW